MDETSAPVIYQFKVVLLGISPMIGRRLLVPSDRTIADFHYIIQIAMGWTDSHLHRFVIHGKQYGIAQIGGIWFSDNPWQVKLSDFGFRVRGCKPKPAEFVQQPQKRPTWITLLPPWDSRR